MSRMIANAYGKRKAERFRKAFNLNTEEFTCEDEEYVDAHDYLHTVLGAMPVWEDELLVLELEEKVLSGTIQLRGIYLEN